MAVTRLDPNQVLKTLILKKQRVTIPGKLPVDLLQSLEVVSHLDEMADLMLFHLNAFMASTEKTEEKTTETVMRTVSVPLTWWDHLKLAHAPEWFLSRWPAATYSIDTLVEHKTVQTTTRLCPHTLMDQEYKHVAWLAGENPK